MRGRPPKTDFLCLPTSSCSRTTRCVCSAARVGQRNPTLQWVISGTHSGTHQVPSPPRALQVNSHRYGMETFPCLLLQWPEVGRTLGGVGHLCPPPTCSTVGFDSHQVLQLPRPLHTPAVSRTRDCSGQAHPHKQQSIADTSSHHVHPSEPSQLHASAWSCQNPAPASLLELPPQHGDCSSTATPVPEPGTPAGAWLWGCSSAGISSTLRRPAQME